MTEVHHPLDIKLFGIMKAKARAFLTTRIANDVLSKYNEETRSFDGPIEPPRAITKREATVIIENAWNDIEEYQITEAWFEAIEKYFTTVSSFNSNNTSYSYNNNNNSFNIHLYHSNSSCHNSNTYHRRSWKKPKVKKALIRMMMINLMMNN